ncbi:hypothetical protein HYT95_01470, partial [Candidatus Peregrinibacteria bacterium]|nr:hypothetical protein [Candidatus Peregrinibacteria bacterium]
HGPFFLCGPSEFLLENELVAQFSLEALCAVRRDNCGVGDRGRVQRRHLSIIEENEFPYNLSPITYNLLLWIILFLSTVIT